MGPERKVIPPRGGLLHVVDAVGYSLAGMLRLWQETAARLEMGAALFVWRGVEVWRWLAALALLALVLTVEALNTAIEELTNHLSPEWSQMAKDAKDLGSLAVGLMLLIAVGFVGAVLVRIL